MSDIPGFDVDESLEDLLGKPVGDLDEETRTELQRYKSRKLKAKRDAGESDSKPEWWDGGSAPERVDDDFSGSSDESPEEPEDSEGTATDSPEETNTSAEGSDESQSTGETKPSQPGENGETQHKPRARAPKRDGMPQIGWSSKGVSGETKQDLLGEPVKAQGNRDDGTAQEPDESDSETASDDTSGSATEPTESTAEADQTDTTEAVSDTEAAVGEPGEVEVPEVDFSDLPGLEHDPELDELLTEDLSELDEETRADVQRYKSRILKAKRDAGESDDVPDWWSVPEAYETLEETDQSRRRPGGTSDASPEESADTTEESEEPSDADSGDGETDEAQPEVDEAATESTEEPAADGAEASGGEASTGDREGVEVPAVDFSDLDGLEHDPELDELLTRGVEELEEDQRVAVQRYKSRILKAKRDAGKSDDAPEWWALDSAPETTTETDQAGVAEGEVATREERLEGGGTTSGSGTEETTESEAQATSEEAPSESDGSEEADESEADSQEQAEEEAVEEAPEDDEPDEPELDPEELGDNPTEDELLKARVIDYAVEQEDSQGIFRTSVDHRKCYLSYTQRSRFLTLHHYELPDTMEDEQSRTWIKDLLGHKAYEYAEENELIVIPQGSDIWEGFLSRHPDLKERTRKPAQY